MVLMVPMFSKVPKFPKLLRFPKILYESAINEKKPSVITELSCSGNEN